MSPAEKVIWAKEVAALIAAGWSPEKIGSAKDLAKATLDEVVNSPEFTQALKAHGEQAVRAYDAYVKEHDAQSARDFLSGRLTKYVMELDEMVLSGALKAEKKADILLALLRFGAPADESLRERDVRMPLALLENFTLRQQAHEEQKARMRDASGDAGRED